MIPSKSGFPRSTQIWEPKERFEVSDQEAGQVVRSPGTSLYDCGDEHGHS